ncbi:hypothetical protein JCM8097_008669 [Rhodosporidiobolus ruineniae]
MSTAKPLPFPGDPAPSFPSHAPPSGPSSRQPRTSSMGQPGQFYSTTTAPLRDHEEEGIPSRPSHDHRRARKSSNNSTTTSSVLARGRPKPAPHPHARPSSFFDPDAAGGGDQGRGGGDWTGPAPRGVSGGEGQGNGQQLDERRDSFFGIDGPRSAGLDSNFPEPDGATVTSPPEPRTASDALQERRSSFYGLDAHAPPHPSGQVVPQRDYSSSPGRNTPSNESHRNLPRHQSSSGSGSYSSHEQPNRPRYSQAPYAASRAASLYGFSSGEPAPPPPAQLLDQSHLTVGNMASLLSHDKTLELYRQNAKKTNDPDIQYEFCTFVMDVVADLEHTTAVEKAAAGKAADAPPSQKEIESKQKQQALVAESITLLNKLAQRGHVKSQYFLADCYTQGIGTPKGKRDYDKAFPLFMLAGKHGHASGSYRAAQCLEHGWGTRKDLSKAVSLYRRAAVLTHTPAMHRLGLAEINGELGLSKRPKDGVQWLTRAAELADQVDPPQPQSLHELAILHEKGIDNVVFQDEEYAAELLARAAELQYAPSAYKLGECYEYGKMGCPLDAALSIHYYNIAAQQNHPAACFALTAWYLVGSPGVLPQSDTEAYLWAKKAAELGLAKAQYACGYFTEVGIGTYKDERDALEWFRKAAAQGDKRAQDRLRMGGHPLPPVDVPSAKRASPQPPPPEPTSSFHLPERQRRLSTTRLLTKNRDSSVSKKGAAKGHPTRGGSADARTAHSFGELPPPVPTAPVDRKGKGKEKSLPSAPGAGPDPAAPSMSPMTRQRSYSQPTMPQPGVQLDYNLRPVPAGGINGGDFGPLAYDHREQAATIGGYGAGAGAGAGGGLQPPYQGEYGRLPAAGGAPPQVRMPARQQVKGSPVLAGEELAEKKKEREKVLQRRKNAGEGQDCIVM